MLVCTWAPYSIYSFIWAAWAHIYFYCALGGQLFIHMGALWGFLEPHGPLFFCLFADLSTPMDAAARSSVQPAEAHCYMLILCDPKGRWASKEERGAEFAIMRKLRGRLGQACA